MLRRAVLFLAVLNAARAGDCEGPFPGSCSLLSQAKAIFVGTAGGFQKESMATRFHVTEAFKGVKGEWIDVAEFPDSLHFHTGEQYLVFAGPCAWAGGGCLMNASCSNTRNLKYAAAILDQLRAEKSGRAVAAVYGTLSTWEARGPLSNIRVRLQSGGRSFEERTDGRGAYAFAQLPRGKYQVSADLPPTMVLFDWSVLSFELTGGDCFENDLYAVPSGRLSGKVIGPDGPLERATLRLYRAGQAEGTFGYQEYGKPFAFDHLTSGDYVVVFDPANTLDVQNRFAATSQPVHLSEGQKILNADIHVSNPMPAHPLKIRWDWAGEAPVDFWTPAVNVKPDKGREIYGSRTMLNLRLDDHYTIRGEVSCRGAKGKMETGEVRVDGGDLSVLEVTLKIEKGECK